MPRDSFQGRTQARIANPFRHFLNAFGRFRGKLHGVAAEFRDAHARLHFEQNAVEIAERFQRLQLALQTSLLVAQARGPMAVGDDQ